MGTICTAKRPHTLPGFEAAAEVDSQLNFVKGFAEWRREFSLGETFL